MWLHFTKHSPKDKFDFYMLPLACMTYNGRSSPPPMAAVQLWTHPLELCSSLDEIIPCCFLVLFVQSSRFGPYIQKYSKNEMKIILSGLLLDCKLSISNSIFCCSSFVTQRCSPNFFTQIFQFGNMFRPGLCLFCY